MMPETLHTMHAVLFDLDNTLIDTERIKELLFLAAQEAGISKEDAQETYRRTRDVNNQMTFTLAHYAQALGKPELEDAFRAALQKEKETLLYKEAKQLLEACRDANIPAHVITLGVLEWQKEKIMLTGVAALVPERNWHSTDAGNAADGKARLIRAIIGKENDGAGYLFVNDKPDETAEILRMFSGLRALVYADARDARYTDPSFDALRTEFGARVDIEKRIV